MDAAEFLQAAHGILRAAIIEHGAPATANVALARVADGISEMELVDATGLAERWRAGEQLIATTGAPLALYGFEVVPAPAKLGSGPWDYIILGIFYERGAVERPFCLEWQAPARLGWYEWADAQGPEAAALVALIAQLREGMG